MLIFSKGEAGSLNPLYDGIIQSLGVSNAEQTYQTTVSVIFWASVCICGAMLLITLKTFHNQYKRQKLDQGSLNDSNVTSETKRNKKDACYIFNMLTIIGGLVVFSLAFKMSDYVTTYLKKDTLPAYNLDSKTDSTIVYAENEIYYTDILQSNYSLLSEADKQAFKAMLFGDVSKECSNNKTHCDIILNNQLLTKALENRDGFNLSQFLDAYKGSLLIIRLNEEESNRLKQEADAFLTIEKRLLDAEKELFKNSVGDVEQKTNPDVRSTDWVNIKSVKLQKIRENKERPELCRKLIQLEIMDLVKELHCEEYLRQK